MVRVDVAIVGGGLQGLVLLRELTSAGYGCVLVTNTDLGSGQTLHSHGLMNSGTGLLTGLVQTDLHEVTLPYLRRLEVPLSGQDRSFLLLPDPVAEQLGPVWAANQYHPERTDASSLPPGLEPVAPAYRVQGYSVDKQRLVAALSAGFEHLILRGEVTEASPMLRVRTEAPAATVDIHTAAVVVAAGCGTKRLLRRVFAVDDGVLDRISYTKPHMLCLRGPAGVLPEIGTVISPELIIVGHPAAGMWYVTPAIPAPPRHAEAPDDGAADVEAPAVALAVDALVRLVPTLSGNDERMQATVFAGFKQDFDGQPTRRACEVLDSERNVLMVLPSVLANTVPNALEAVTIIRQRLGPGTPAPDVSWPPVAAVGRLNEDGGASQWMTWSRLARTYGGVR